MGKADQIDTRTAKPRHQQTVTYRLKCSAGYNHTIHLPAIQFDYLFNIVFIMIIHAICCAIFLCNIKANLSGSDSKNPSRAVKNCGANSHKSYRTYAENCNTVTKLHIEISHTGECGAHHVCHHQCLLQRNIVRNMCQ